METVQSEQFSVFNPSNRDSNLQNPQNLSRSSNAQNQSIDNQTPSSGSDKQSQKQTPLPQKNQKNIVSSQNTKLIQLEQINEENNQSYSDLHFSGEELRNLAQPMQLTSGNARGQGTMMRCFSAMCCCRCLEKRGGSGQNTDLNCEQLQFFYRMQAMWVQQLDYNTNSRHKEEVLNMCVTLLQSGKKDQFGPDSRQILEQSLELEVWRHFGFQNNNPLNDFRASGLFGVHQFHFFAQNYPQDLQMALECDSAHFYLALFSIRLSHTLLALFNLVPKKSLLPDLRRQELKRGSFKNMIMLGCSVANEARTNNNNIFAAAQQSSGAEDQSLQQNLLPRSREKNWNWSLCSVLDELHSQGLIFITRTWRRKFSSDMDPILINVLREDCVMQAIEFIKQLTDRVIPPQPRSSISRNGRTSGGLNDSSVHVSWGLDDLKRQAESFQLPAQI